MDLKQYITDAIRTESKIDSVVTNPDVLKAVLSMFIASGNLLDMIKKNVYYGKPIDIETWENRVHQSYQAVSFLSYDESSPWNDKVSIEIDPRVFHAIVGICTESTELAEAVTQVIENGIELDTVNIREELFDHMWYWLIGHDAINQNPEDTLEMGFEKLRRRYPDKFTSHNAINRDIDAEREILEKY